MSAPFVMSNPFRTHRSLLACSIFGVASLALLARPVPRAGEDDDDDDKDNRPSGRRRQNPADIVEKFNGSAVRMAGHVIDVEADNGRLRDKKREWENERTRLNSEIETLKGKVPAEGSRVLTPEQGTAWDAYNKIGTPQEVATLLDKGKAAIERVGQDDKKATLEHAAKVAKFNPAILKLVAKDLQIVVREVEAADANGKIGKVERAFVVTRSGDKDESTPIETYFKAQGEDVLKTLQAGVKTEESNEDLGDDGHNQEDDAPAFPVQGAGKRNNDSDWSKLDSFTEERYGHVLPKSETAAK